jgi:hypothetical protein
VFACLTSFSHRDPLLLNGGDNLLRLLAFWLIFSEAGKALSVDTWLKRSKACELETSQPWAQRFMQVQIALVYADSVIVKCLGTNWLNGQAVYYSARLEEFKRLPVPYLFDHLWSLKLLTWSTLAIEVALCTLIWNKRWRYWVLLAGTIMHLAIDMVMNIPQFQWIMIAAYVLFIEPEHLLTCFHNLKKLCRWARCAATEETVH